jgi:hypothetical protein
MFILNGETLTNEAVGSGDSRYLVLSSAKGKDPATTDLASARAEAVRASGPTLLFDAAAGTAEVICGTAAVHPAFIVADGPERLKILEGAPMLRYHAPTLAPTPAGVSHLLAFGHPQHREPLLGGVWALQAGEARRLDLRHAGWCVGPPRRAAQSSPLTEVGPNALAELLGDIAGAKVTIAAASLGPATTALERACWAAGASWVELAGVGRLPDSLSMIQSAATALTFVPFGDPRLLADAAVALSSASTAEVVVVDWGADAWFASSLALRNFTRALARRVAAQSRSVAGGYLTVGQFARDLLFAETCVFSDDERLRIIGPALLSEGFIAMADELGEAFEEVPPAYAATLAGRLDPGYQPGGSAAALRTATAALTGRPILAPFLDAPVPEGGIPWAEGNEADVTVLRPKDVMADRLPQILSDSAAVFEKGFLARNRSLVRVLSQGSAGSPRLVRQAFTLLALEKWLRIVRGSNGEGVGVGGPKTR